MEEPSRWRIWAKGVGVVDTLLTTLLLLRTIWLGYIAVGATLAVSDGSLVVPSKTSFLGQMWTIYVYDVISALCQLWVAVKLWHGTDLAFVVTIPKMLQKSRLWRNVNLPFLLISGILHTILGSYIVMAVLVVIKITFLLIIWTFIQELEYLQLNPPMPVPVPMQMPAKLPDSVPVPPLH